MLHDKYACLEANSQAHCVMLITEIGESSVGTPGSINKGMNVEGTDLEATILVLSRIQTK